MSRMPLKPAHYETSIAGWSFALSDALDSYGLDGRQLFREVGIELDEVTSASARLPISRVQQVWRYAGQHTDEDFGLKVAEFLSPASLHALGFALWCSSTLRDYFERYIRYRCVLSHMHFCELVDEEEYCRFRLVDERNIKSEITNDAAVGFFLRMARSLSDYEVKPKAMFVTRNLESGCEGLRAFCGVEISDNSSEYALLLDRQDLERKLRFANPELASMQDAIVERYIAEHGLISEYMLRVRSVIQKLLQEGEVSVEGVAEKLNVTVRTLQRRLSDENSSYNKILDDVRLQIALEDARNPAVSATELAFRLGFLDSGSFGRSFRRWTGKSFSDYRAELQQE